MQDFYQSLGFITGFVILVLIIKAAVGEKASATVVGVVLLSVSLLNYQKITAKLHTVFNV